MEESNVTLQTVSGVSPRAAFELLKEEIAAVPDERIMKINVDIATAVTSAVCTIPALQKLRPELSELPGFDVEQLDKLNVYAMAAYHTNYVYGMAIQPLESMPELVAEATRIRDLLYSDALALAHRGIFEQEAFRTVRTAIGYRALANDLGVLATLLSEKWEQVKSRCAVVEADLAAAEDLQLRIINAVAQKEQAPSSELAKAGLTRQRAYSLFMRAYSQARRGVTYLRWDHNDTEAIVPSLFAGRRTGKRQEEVEPTTPAPESPDEPPPALNPSLPAGIVPALASPPSSANTIPIGMPGADPFTRS